MFFFFFARKFNVCLQHYFHLEVKHTQGTFNVCLGPFGYSIILLWDHPLLNHFKYQTGNCVSPIPNHLPMLSHISASVLLKIRQKDCKIILIALAWPKNGFQICWILVSMCARPLQRSLRRSIPTVSIQRKSCSSQSMDIFTPGKVSARKAFLKRHSLHTSLDLLEILHGLPLV